MTYDSTRKEFLRDRNEFSVEGEGHNGLNFRYETREVEEVEKNKLGRPAPGYKITLQGSTGAGPTK